MMDRKPKGRIEVKAGAGGLRVAKALGRTTHLPGPRGCWCIMPRLSSVACKREDCGHPQCAEARRLVQATCRLCGQPIVAEQNYSPRGLGYVHLTCEHKRLRGGVDGGKSAG